MTLLEQPGLAAAHLEALEWFSARSGRIISWPAPMPNGTYLMNKPKGIHKPRGWKYALSIRQALGSPYSNEEPIYDQEGRWTYRYFQEAQATGASAKFTNRALQACQEDGVPVAVLRQVHALPARYHVLGLASVEAVEGNCFVLRSWRQNTGASQTSDFDPSQVIDNRQRTLQAIVQRRGRGTFRTILLAAYERRCAITGCDCVDALEAAHIISYFGPETDHIQNGLLLRSDIHTLFDLGLISVDSHNWTAIVHPAIHQTHYGNLHGAVLKLPALMSQRPSVAALDAHRAQTAGAQPTWIALQSQAGA